MNYCSYCDIVHDTRYCPLCEAKNEITNLEKTILELEDKIQDLENKND